MTEQETGLAQNRERWHLAKVDDKLVRELAEKLDIDYLLAKILLVRNIGTSQHFSVEEFLNPDPNLIHEFEGVSSKEELDKGVNRVLTAINSKEIIMINGDPDADGITGATVLVSGLRHLGANVTYEFPIRCREGHGLQVRIIDQVKEMGGKLIITTDCGSKDINATDYANQKGIDVVITDHHILGKRLPKAYALINPNLGDSIHYKTLAGASVSLKFIQAIFAKKGEEIPESLLSFMLAVATLGTLSDRMSLLNPMNRLIIKRGIESITTTSREGLKALKRVCHEKGKVIKARELSRSIIPRLNAPGRIGDPEQGIPDAKMVVDLLIIGVGRKNAKKALHVAELFSSVLDKNEANKKEALSAASNVDDVNEKRKYLTNKIEEEMDMLINEQVSPLEDRIIVVQGENWNSGVIGIDTDRLKERFLRPAIILTKYDGNDYVRGSVRSIPKIDMYAIIDKVEKEFYDKHNRYLFQTEVITKLGPQLVNAFGGHAQACGFTLHTNDVKEFIQLVKEEGKDIPDENFNYHYEIIDKLPFSKLNTRFLSNLDKLAPYGQRFEYPIFYLQGCILSQGRPFGNKYQEIRKMHVNFSVIEKRKHHDRNTRPLEFQAVGFNLWEKFCEQRSNLNPDARYDVIFTIEKNRQNFRQQSKEEIRLNVLDIRPSGENVDSFLTPTSEEDDD